MGLESVRPADTFLTIQLQKVMKLLLKPFGNTYPHCYKNHFIRLKRDTDPQFMSHFIKNRKKKLMIIHELFHYFQHPFIHLNFAAQWQKR